MSDIGIKERQILHSVANDSPPLQCIRR